MVPRLNGIGDFEMRRAMIQGGDVTSERERFNEEGFYIFRNVLNRAVIEEIVTEIGQVFCDQLRVLGIDPEPENLSPQQAMKRLFDLDLKRYLAATSVLARLAGVGRLLHSEPIWKVVQRLGCRRAAIPTHPVTHLMSPDLQIPDGYYGLEPHQDWPSLQGSLDAFVVWVPLVDIDAGMNPLELIPGSHRNGLMKAEIGQNESVIDPRAFRESDFIPLEVHAGDIAVMTSFTVHRSSKVGRTGAVRLACSTRYENMEEATYAERGYPSAYKRSIHRDLYVPGFPNQQQVLKAFGFETTEDRETPR